MWEITINKNVGIEISVPNLAYTGISVELSLSQSGFALLKIQSVQDEDQLHEVLLQDDVLQVLEEIGYKGVPQKETLVSSTNVIQWVVK